MIVCLASLLFSILFFYVTTSMPSSPLSFAPGDTTLPSTLMVLAPLARDGLPPHFDGGRHPLGHDRNSFLSCPYCDKKNHHAKKCKKQFGKPPIAQSIVTTLATFYLVPFSIPTPQYHVTLMLAEYDVLHYSRSTDTSSSSSLTSPCFLLPPR